MKDILKKYKKHKTFTNIGIVVTSLVLAIWFNLFLIDGSNLGNSMKASVLETKIKNNRADIYWEYSENTIKVFSSKNMNNVKNLSLSFTYNPVNVEIISKTSDSAEIIELSNENGINTIVLNYNQEKNILKNDTILSIYSKKTENISEQLNIFNANFTDTTSENFLLSTSGITF
jgi:hypothetical protein